MVGHRKLGIVRSVFHTTVTGLWLEGSYVRALRFKRCWSLRDILTSVFST